jgi:hypothetical protein
MASELFHFYFEESDDLTPKRVGCPFPVLGVRYADLRSRLDIMGKIIDCAVPTAL